LQVRALPGACLNINELRSLGKVQIRNAKEVFWEIVSVDQHANL